MPQPKFRFTRDQARTMMLAAQGFSDEVKTVNGLDDVLATIRRMGILQIDTIHVIARSPYLVLWSRLGTYEPQLLDRLLSDGALFEYWSHEACFIPIEDYRIYRRFMIDKSKHKGRYAWLDENKESVESMIAHVRENGPTRSADFVRTDGRKGNWWDWKHEKVALDFLHTSGELMIAKREKFQRIYDLRERVLPTWHDSDAPSRQDAIKSLVLKTVTALGVAAESWCSDYYRLLKKDVRPQLLSLIESGDILSVELEGMPGAAYISQKNLDLAARVCAEDYHIRGSSLLSPFDPIVWDRKRALDLFDFDYRIECYVPEPKRRYGYFVLPILVDNQIVGRLDAKAHRKEKVFEVRALFLEPTVEDSDELVNKIGNAIFRCATWHETPKIRVSKADRPRLARRVQKAARA